MSTTITVNSAICGFTHRITGRLEGEHIIADHMIASGHIAVDSLTTSMSSPR